MLRDPGDWGRTTSKGSRTETGLARSSGFWLRALLIGSIGCTAPLPIFDDGGADSGPSDSGPIDAGLVDAGSIDSGSIDAGPIDAGSIDAGPIDAGPPCPSGFADCDHDLAMNCEADLSSDETCGTCDVACPLHRSCVDGSCAAPRIEQIATGDEHTCALAESGTVYCWGIDNRGELGDGFTDGSFAENRAEARPVVGVTNASAIYTGGGVTCAIDRTDGTALCWGYNEGPTFGDGVGAQATPTPEALLFSGVLDPILELAHSGSHLCVRTATAVLCSGRNAAHQLGRESPTTHLLGRVEGLPSDDGVLSVAAGYSATQGFTLVALANGTVWCWGANDDSECAQPASAEVSVPTQIAGLSNIVQVVAGWDFACALDMLGVVRCWGSNASGRTGNGIDGGPDVATPTRVASSIPPIGRLSAALGSVLAVTPDGHGVWGWGANQHNLLGLGPVGAGPRPTPEPVIVESSSTFEPAVGGLHACLLRRRGGMDDAILCAGSNDRLQLGMDPAPDPMHFTQVPGFP